MEEDDGRQPAAEPMAAVVPADNYYYTFHSPKKVLAFAELLDLWGTDLLHAFEFRSREPYLRRRYQT